MHEVNLLVNITIALVVAFIGGLIARRLGMPTIVGYLLAGVAIGPFTPGFVGDVETITQLAELGVIFLMFGVGLHFSFSDLWKVRDIAIPGAIVQIAVVTLIGFGLGQLWGWSVPAGIVLGFAISIASTVVLLRGLMDTSLLNTPHGQAAVGWVVMQDLATVLFLVLMPAIAQQDGGGGWQNLGLTLLKAAGFIAIMFFVGSRLLPWLLNHIARTGSRELFILAVLTIALGTALGSAQLFGVSLALGAFVAGAVVSESPLSHQVGADLLPFREAFAILFFVSIGMLVDPAFLFQNIGQVLIFTALIVLGKTVITMILGFLFHRPALTALIIGVGLSQIGEFSFIIGEAGLALGMLSQDQVSLILAGALLSISINPLMFRLLGPLERLLQNIPVLWERINRHGPLRDPREEELANHVVIVGASRMGGHLIDVLETLNVPHLVIESDVDRVEELNQRGTITLFGDAANSEVITHAHLDRARALVITVPDEAASGIIVASALDLNPQLPVIARAATEEGGHNLARLGANQVILPELEGGLEMVHYTLEKLGFPLREIHGYVDAVRKDLYDLAINSDEEHRSLHQLISAARYIEIYWIDLPEDSPLIGQTLAEANIRMRTSASVVALVRNGHVIPNPKSRTVFEEGDRIGLIGEEEQIQAARSLFSRVDVLDSPSI